MNHKEATAHIRNELKVAGIKARVRLYEACSTKYVNILHHKYEGRFSADQIEALCLIAKNAGLTCARRSPIDEKHQRLLTNKNDWHFEFHGPKH